MLIQLWGETSRAINSISFRRAADPSRHHQVADQEPLKSHSVFIQRQVAHLAVHLFDRFPSHPGIIANLRVFFAAICSSGIFEIGHIDIDNLIQEAKGLGPLVATAIINEGQLQPPPGGYQQAPR